MPSRRRHHSGLLFILNLLLLILIHDITWMNLEVPRTGKFMEMENRIVVTGGSGGEIMGSLIFFKSLMDTKFLFEMMRKFWK